MTAQRDAVLVIGARGALGSLVADAFQRDGWRVRPASRGAGPTSSHHHVDLGDPRTLTAALEEVSLVVTTVADPTLAVERHVLAHGGLLLNLSAGPAVALESLRGHRSASAGTVVMNAGIAPGVTNLVAAALLGDHPEADEVELVFTVTTRGSGGPASGDFAHRGFTGRRHHRVTRVTLPTPYGTRDVLGFAEQDGGWFGRVADSVSVSPYVCVAERPVQRLLLALNRARLISALPRRALGQGRRTGVTDASTEPVAHSVRVLRNGHPLASRRIEGRGDFRMAAASTVVLAQALLEPGRSTPGAWSPEELVQLSEVEDALRAAGVEVTVAQVGEQP